jgi:glycosyltransferase involved in cell wall biosynthesis
MIKISIVTPTKDRIKDIKELVINLENLNYNIFELIIVDASEQNETIDFIKNSIDQKMFSYSIKIIKKTGGPAIQRNEGVKYSTGEIITFIDDDIRLDVNYFNYIAEKFENDTEKKIGGITGYIENQYFDSSKTIRWIWYKKLSLLKEFEPGKYDFQTGYPINRYMQKPYKGFRKIDFTGAGCVSWRKEIFNQGYSFSDFFKNFSILEDTHFALKVSRNWDLLECGDAKCLHLHSGGSHRKEIKKKAIMSAINYYYVFKDICGPLSFKMRYRFIRFQLFELLRSFVDIFRFRTKNSIEYFIGKSIGVYKVIFDKI